jgi:hypothetical protein
LLLRTMNLVQGIITFHSTYTSWVVSFRLGWWYGMVLFQPHSSITLDHTPLISYLQSIHQSVNQSIDTNHKTTTNPTVYITYPHYFTSTINIILPA